MTLQYANRENKMKINLVLKNIRKNGLCILKNIYSKKETLKFKKKLKIVYDKRVKNKGSFGTDTNQVLYNYFYEDLSLLKLIYNKKIDKILSVLLDENYVLQSTNAQNRLINSIKSKNGRGIGNTWHTDSRYLGGKKISSGFSYLVIIALDPFNNSTGATKFIPGSFNSRVIPKRKLLKKQENKSKQIIMKEGSVCIMDTGMWHKAGESSLKSRWSIFNIYTGWFVKPYYDYSLLRKKKIKKIYKKLLHEFCTPPKLSNKEQNTLIQFKKIEKKIL